MYIYMCVSVCIHKKVYIKSTVCKLPKIPVTWRDIFPYMRKKKKSPLTGEFQELLSKRQRFLFFVFFFSISTMTKCLKRGARAITVAWQKLSDEIIEIQVCNTFDCWRFCLSMKMGKPKFTHYFRGVKEYNQL